MLGPKIERLARLRVLPRVISGTAVLNTGATRTTGKVSLDTEGCELSSAPSYGEGLAGSSASTLDETSSKEAILPAAESRRFGGYLPGPQRTTTYKGGTKTPARSYDHGTDGLRGDEGRAMRGR